MKSTFPISPTSVPEFRLSENALQHRRAVAAIREEAALLASDRSFEDHPRGGQLLHDSPVLPRLDLGHLGRLHGARHDYAITATPGAVAHSRITSSPLAICASSASTCASCSCAVVSVATSGAYRFEEALGKEGDAEERRRDDRLDGRAGTESSWTSQRTTAVKTLAPTASGSPVSSYDRAPISAASARPSVRRTGTARLANDGPAPASERI